MYKLDNRINDFFSKEALSTIGKKIEKLAIANKSRAKTKLTKCEIFKFQKSLESDNIECFNIYINKEKWTQMLDSWLIDCQQIQTVVFNYANNFLEKNAYTDDTQSQKYYSVDLMEHHTLTDHIYILSREQDIDPSSFSCKNSYRKHNITEWRARACSKTPIYISFIHNETIDKYYIKLWFNIDAQVDIVVESLQN